jgi:radical SAM superfamily enzyme YgiQ (UPF0313 family)
MLERNVVLKSPLGRLRVALVYPNLYAAGMSNLGYQIVYDLLNSVEDVYCERFFLGQERTIETASRLRDFDVVAFSWQFELDAVNIIRILHTSRVPVRRGDRGDGSPLVVIGGPCAVNPYPLRHVADLFFIGEAEEGLLEVVEAWRGQGDLEALRGYNGIYLSAMDNEVERVYLRDLDTYHPVAQVTSPEAAFGESFLLEASRGCSFGCRFCMGGYIFRPRRERSLSRLMEVTEEGIEACSPKKIAVLGASVSDYSRAEELLEYLAGTGLEVSVPSLRAGSLTKRMVRAIAGTGQRTITFAPESSERLRLAVNKRISDQEFVEAVELAAEMGIRNIKLYYMLGLPGETEEDVREVISFVKGLRARVKLSVTPFIPKPHTPLQWAAFQDLKTLRRRMRLLRKELRCVFEGLRASLLQAVIARGDDALGEALIEGAIAGGSLGEIRKAARKRGIDLSRYLGERSPGEPLPWDKIRAGPGRDFLYREYSRTVDAAICGAP